MYFVPKDWTERLTRGGRRQRGSSYYEEEVHSSRVKRWNFFLKIKMLSGNKQDKVLLQENWRKVKVYGYRTWNGLWLIKEEKKSIESMLRDRRMARKPGEQGSHKGKESGEVRTGMGGDVCSSLFLQPAHRSWSASRELAMKGGPAVSEQTARAITGAFVLIPFTELSRSIKLI